ncbi:NAD(P)H-dependent FMN reductase [Bradyrhizobium sp. i1.3.6]
MSNRILVLYGSYRSDRMGVRLANFVIDRLRQRGEEVEFIDAKAIGLPMLDRMYKEYPKGAAPEALEKLAGQIRGADGFVFVTGEYNWGIQPGLKNLTDHFLEEWFWRPAAIVSYSAGPTVRRTRLDRLAWHAVGDGHGRGVEHHRRRPDRADAVGRERADRRGRQGTGALVPALCR